VSNERPEGGGPVLGSKSLTIVVPAYNEEGNISPTCLGIVELAEKHLKNYEILVFDDASTDKTAEKVRELERNNPHIHLIQNERNRGLGYNYFAGVQKASCHDVMLIPGDNEVVSASLENIFRNLGESDIGICYASNSVIRPKMRQLISTLFTGMLNFLFGLKVIYFNGPNVIRTDLARKYLPQTSSFAYMAVLLVLLLKQGYSFKHYTFELRPRFYGKATAFRLQNVMRVMRDVAQLLWRVYFSPSK
jgi:dolichol-phosphate mannosyltransferase